MLHRGQRVLVETNVIIEAHRTGCWNALVGYFSVETTDMCCTEAASGNPHEPGYVPVDTERLRKAVKIHQVTPPQMAQAALRAAGMSRNDDGERELLAFAAAEAAPVVLSCSDRRAVIVGRELGLLDRFISLEELAEAVGARCHFKTHYTKKWLSQLRTDLELDNL